MNKRVIKTAMFVVAVVAASVAYAVQSGASSPVNSARHAEYRTSNAEGQKKVHDFLKECKYYFLATADGDQPRVRPFGTATLHEGKLYIQTGHKKKVSKQIAKNPRFEICAYNGQRWVRISGKLVEDERVEAKKAILDDNPSLKGMYSETDPNTAIYYITEGEAVFSTFSGDETPIKF